MTIKTTNIPQRQKCVSKEHPYIGGAADIFDDALNKPQEQVNADILEEIGADDESGSIKGRVKDLEDQVGEGGTVDERIAAAVAPKANSADVYLKTETYNKSELNDMITTPNQEYVTLVAESGDTLSDIFDGITGAADTTYRVGNWDGSANSGAGGYDITTYSEYAYNGTNFVHLSTKTQIGDVFDISAYHATGGTPAKYADLTAALGTNGANIPEAIRKGGMSVKYVQSSDNKYVQFRFMLSGTFTDAQFTNVANWQGVDDKPTAGSKNLVESGGVKEQVFSMSYCELGSIDTGSGLNVENTTGTRARTKNKIYTDGNITIVGGNITCVVSALFYKDDILLGSSNLYNGTGLHNVALQFEQEYDSVKIVFLTSGNLSEEYQFYAVYGSSAVSMNTKEVIARKANMQESVNNEGGILKLTLTNQSIDSKTGQVVDNIARALTQPIKAYKGTSISVNTGSLFICLGFLLDKNENYIKNISPVSNYVMETDGYIRFVFSKSGLNGQNLIDAVVNTTNISINRNTSAWKVNTDEMIELLSYSSVFEFGSIDSSTGIEADTLQEGTRARSINGIDASDGKIIILNNLSGVSYCSLYLYKDGYYKGALNIAKPGGWQVGDKYEYIIPDVQYEYNIARLVFFPTTGAPFDLQGCANSYIKSCISVAGLFDSVSNINKTYEETIKFKPFYLEVPRADGEDGSIDLDTLTVSELYTMWDELITNYPSYLTSTNLGTDESGDYQVRKIVFNFNEDNYVKRKVIMTVNLHGPGSAGDSRMQSYLVYYFIKWILDNKETNELAEWFIMNYQFVFIPIANPWGYDNNSRGNSRSVDLNRNFDADWVSGESYAGTTFGSSAASEKETQYAQTMIQDNKDAYLFIDFHSHLKNSNLLQILPLTNSFAFKLGKDAKRFCKIAGESRIDNYLENIAGTAKKYAEDVHRIPSLVLEAAPYDGVSNFSSKAMTDSMRMFLSMLRQV